MTNKHTELKSRVFKKKKATTFAS